jgi:phosphohistidine phosphatase
MKTLLIVRHAKTHQAEWGEADFDRKLTARGKDNAKEIVDFILGKKQKIDLLVSSPAKRAKQTCKIFAEALDIDKKKIQYEESLYEAPAMAYHKLLKQLPDNKNCIAIFGHNNGITQFADDLLPEIDIPHIPTGAVVAVTADVEKWSKFQDAEKKLLFFEVPKGHLQ